MVTVAVFLFLLAVVCAGGVGVFALMGRASPQLDMEDVRPVMSWFARMAAGFALAGAIVLAISATYPSA